MLGVTQQVDVFYRKNPIGLKEVYKFAESIDPQKTKQLVPYFPKKSEDALMMTHKLYRDIIKKKLSSSAPKPQLKCGIDFKNGYYIPKNKRDIKKASEGIALLEKLAMFRLPELDEEEKAKSEREMGSRERKKKTKGGEAVEGGLATMKDAMMKIESAKINVVARLAREKLEENSHNKVILSLNYRDGIERLSELLKEYNPLILTGKITNQKTRDCIVEAFQEDNEKYRLLIMITTVGSVGLDLDDKYGDWERWMFIIPDYRFLEKYQATGRIARLDTKSKPHLRFVYLQGIFVAETKLLDAIQKQSKIASELLAGENNIAFPGDLPSEYEEE